MIAPLAPALRLMGRVCRRCPGTFDKGKMSRFEQEINAAAGRPSGRRPFITAGGMGASAPILFLMSSTVQKTEKGGFHSYKSTEYENQNEFYRADISSTFSPWCDSCIKSMSDRSRRPLLRIEYKNSGKPTVLYHSKYRKGYMWSL